MNTFASIRPSFRLAASAPTMAGRTFSSSAARSVARMIITGRLGSEPELSATSTGQDIIRYSVGTSTGSRDKPHTSWFRVASFLPEGAQRDFILGLPKGTLVYVEGDASMRSYEDAEGRKQTSFNIVQRHLDVLKRGANSEEESH
ncbi:ssDNA-binding protein mitochondrial [Penicillium manginii]|uniref:ssDNA-binding protein mitochondrial n=1 Tax=Penicillium manginii TaxID=203109 RepID=UPI0025493DFE|nr:ssDNA-binding protein mitochondrial [Penicillium manginii]KAJ5756567.1 ssDNA-binding protein mitochondrial [Penicillium manginii]